ncbi:MAG: patatin-like phospholipase family protein [Xenococcaceae cyanobacterium]
MNELKRSDRQVTTITKTRQAIFLWIGIVLAVLVVWRQSSEAVWQYLFLLRLPILMALLLVTLPLIAKFWLPAMLKNLFVLRDKWQLTFVIISALIAGMAVILVADIMLLNLPARFGVPEWLKIPQFWQYGLAIALGLPTCLTATDLSREELKGREIWTGVIVGGLSSIVVLLAVNLTREWLASNASLKQLLVDIIYFIAKHDTSGYINPQSGELTVGHLSAIAFLLVGLLVYSLVFIFFKPRPIPERFEASALFYVMLLISVITLFGGGATFYFDYFRVPLLFLFLVFSAGIYWLFQVNHFFELKEDKKVKNKAADPQLSDFKTVLETRLEHQNGEPTLVIVCASGGGIQAAGWTVQVLTGLQRFLGKSFTKAIGLISSASGGSVGTMYYLDRFGSLGFPEDDELDNIFNSATEDGLDAIGWGLAYPDLWRLIGLPFFAPRMLDRGTVLETDWKGEMQDPKKNKSLATWREQILKGEIPIPIFNATLVEDGLRFLIAPMTFGECFEKKYVDFNNLYGDFDIDVVTAARLSATFPYISPICRNNNNNLQRNYHVADGGYFDNSGLFTMVEWLNEWLNPKKNLNIKRVLLLQINAFPQSLPETHITGEGGWFMTFVGPLLTLFSVRNSTQTARNLTEVNILTERWKDQVDIKHFPIFFPSSSEMDNFYKSQKKSQRACFFSQEGQYQPPLSWKLTKKEKQALEDAWESIKKDSTGVVEKIKKLWQEEWNMPDD